ncbi:MAG: peptidoglycan-binding protein [Planctomycetota bacterium]|nr:peptidoglycan-binding protein [Planctomycetota bacterium]
MSQDRVHVVESGDCMSSIATAEGFFWQTLWDHNADLKSKRKNPNVLMPGDEVLIPEKRIKQVSAATEQRHRFRKKGTPAKLRIMLERDDQPIKNTSYKLDVDGKITQGTTDDKGFVEVSISPMAQHARIEIEDLVYELELGGLDPVDEVQGVQGRLQNLGFYHGDIDGQLTPDTREAIADFQSWAGIRATGELDDATKNKLLEWQDQNHTPPASHASSSHQSSEACGNGPEEPPQDSPANESELEEEPPPPEIPTVQSDRP